MPPITQYYGMDRRQPTNSDVLVWRYIDFTKYVSLLESSALFFSRADLVNDPFEGSLPSPTTQRRPEKYADRDDANEHLEKLARARKEWRRQVYLSCWHMSDYESAAMWNLYSKTDESVAIQSSYSSLLNCLPERNDFGEFYIGRVSYIDYEGAVLDNGPAQ